jgi:hypothetical protein
MKVIQDVCLKYACDCTVRTATKLPQPIEKSTTGASLLAQVIVAKWADHQPLHRQEKMFERHGIEISRKTMGGWMAQCAELLDPLYQLMKKELLSSKVIGTDDTSVKVLDRKLPFARIGRIWPYVGDVHHPVIVYDYTPTRSRAGPAKFLEGYKGYLQADAYSVYDAFFKSERGMTEVGCWMHARRYFFKALESDEPHMGPAMHLIARLYAVEERAKTLSLSAQQRLVLRQRVSARLLGKLHQYLLELQPEVLPKSPSGAAVRYALNQWEALTRFLEDGELEIDNGATERANRDIALGRGNWTFFGSDGGGKTAACCEASSLPASGAASSRLPGSTMCSRASRRTLSPGSVNCFPTTGSQRFPQPKLKQAADTTNRGLSPVAVYETLTNRRGGGDSCR